LISGSWGLVERVESDGKRHYLIVETARARRLLALTGLEAEIVELSARGLTGKAVAYALGVSRPSVSHALSAAAFKLGLPSRTELVRLVAELLGTGQLKNTVALTAAERDVLTLVRLGWTNATIARVRGRSEHTVANQVSALLKKLGAPSRRVLATARRQ
jgi:DNA-binding CsgD family transcriptional regulator